MDPALTLMISSLASRAHLLAALLEHLRSQADGQPVEILAEVDSGERPLSQKRNALLARATGRFVASIDDDDWVASDYVVQILAAIRQDPDVPAVTFRGVQTDDGRFAHHLRWTVRARLPFDNLDHRIVLANHITPLRRDIALRSRHWLPLPYGSDQLYWRPLHLAGLLPRATFIDSPLYEYRFHSRHTATEQPAQIAESRSRGPFWFATLREPHCQLAPRTIVLWLPWAPEQLPRGCLWCMAPDGSGHALPLDLLDPLPRVEFA